jgi:hypothetical protein
VGGVVTPVTLLVGVILILAAVALFFLDKFKPGCKRDSDTVYSILFLTVGILSLVNFNAGPAESFQLLVFSGMLISLMIDNVRRRTPNSAPNYPAGNSPQPNFRQESRNPYREPKPSRAERDYGYGNYDYEEPKYRSEIQAEFDEGPAMMEPKTSRRQIPGSREPRDSRRGRDYPESEAQDNRQNNRDDYRRNPDEASYPESRGYDSEEQPPQSSREARRNRRRGGNAENGGNPESSARSGSSGNSGDYGGNYSEGYGESYSENYAESYGENYSGSNKTNTNPNYGDSYSETYRGNDGLAPSNPERSSRKSRSSTLINEDSAAGNAPRRRPKSKLNLGEDDAPVSGGDYVDYQPLDQPLGRSGRSETPPAENPPSPSAPPLDPPPVSSNASESTRPRRRPRPERLGDLGDPLDLGSDDPF